MTVRVPKSQAHDGFDADVAAHAFEMRHWRAHMARVAEDEKNKVEPIDRHIAHPRPGAMPLIEACVNENDVADYEIFDDGPTEDQILAMKRLELIGKVTEAEQAAIATVVPIGKRRIFDLREHDILVSDEKIIRDLEPGWVAKVASTVGVAKKIDVQAELEKRRPAEDTKFMQEQSGRRARINAIQRIAAQMHSDIEDLTAETVGSWVMPNFPD